MEFHKRMQKSLLDVLENTIGTVKEMLTLWDVGEEEKEIFMEENIVTIILLGLYESQLCLNSLLVHLNNGENLDIDGVHIILQELRIIEVDCAEVTHLKGLTLFATCILNNARVNKYASHNVYSKRNCSYHST